MGASKSGLSNSMSSPQQPAGQQVSSPYQRQQQQTQLSPIPPTDSPDKFYSWLVEQAKRNPRGTKNG